MGARRQLALALPIAGLLGLIVTPRAAGQAQPAFVAADFFVGVQATPGVNLNTFEVTRFFNLARYQCYQPFYFFIGLQPSGRAKRAAELANVGDAGSMSLWLGLNCDSLLNQIDSTRCQQIAHEPLRGWPIIQPSPWETIAAPSRRRSCAARC